MKVQTATRAIHADPVRIVDRLEDMDAVFEEAVDAVIWRRRLPQSVMSFLDAVPIERMSEGRFNLSVSEVHKCVSQMSHKWGIHDEAARDWIASDVRRLAAQYARVLGASRLLLRVEWVRDDACRKFHRDMVRARLICTYRGPGTEYRVASERDAQGGVDAVSTGEPILLKGQLWPEPPNEAVFHRSAPIEHLGVSRLIVVINEATPEIL